MENLAQYLEATFLKTESDGFSFEQLQNSVEILALEAVQNQYKVVMVRPQWLVKVRHILQAHHSNVRLGTVIHFPKGASAIEEKIAEATKSIAAGVDELDVVINYRCFKQGKLEEVAKEVLEITRYVLSEQKTIKWIIETAALTPNEIIRLCVLIKKVVLKHFTEFEYDRVYVKSSTGDYVTANDEPNGATIENIVAMLENSFPLPVKASGGISTYEKAKLFLDLGVKRIGTSSQKMIIEQARTV